MGGGASGIGSSTQQQISRAAEREAERLRALNDAPAQNVDQSTVETFNELVGNSTQDDDNNSADEAGGATPDMLPTYPIDYYGSDTPSDDPAQQRAEIQAEADAIIESALETDATEAYAPFQALQVSVADADVSSDVRDAVLADSRTEEIIDETVEYVQAEFDDGANFGGAEYALESGLDSINEVLVIDADPDVAAALLNELYPEIDNRVRDARDQLPGYGHIDGENLASLEQISDRVSRAEEGDHHIERLATYANELWPAGEYQFAVSDAGLGGSGVDLAIEMARQRAVNGDPMVDTVLTTAVRSAESYTDSVLSERVDDYIDHTEEMNFYISQFGGAMTPEQLAAAVDSYQQGQGSDWMTEYAANQDALAESGADFLRMADALMNLPPELAGSIEADGRIDQRLTALAEDDNVGVAVSAALDTIPEVVSEINIDGAIQFFDVPKYANRAYGIGTKIANAYVATQVVPVFADLDPDNLASVAAANDALDSLRTTSFARALTVEGGLDELNTAIDALEDTLRVNNQEGFEAANALLQQRLEELPSFGNQTMLGLTFRGLGLAASIAGAYKSTEAAINDPSVQTITNALVADAGAATGIVDLSADLGAFADDGPLVTRFGGASPIGKALGVAGLGLSVVGVVNDLNQGEYVNATLGAVGVGGTAWALFGSSAWAGPVGGGIAIAAAVGSIGYNRFRSVQESNRFTGENAATFLTFADFTDDAARNLTDRSGEGYSPLPALIAYGEARGLGTTDTVQWYNRLDPEIRDEIRDHFHHRLDDVDGDVEQIDNILAIPWHRYPVELQALELAPGDWNVIPVRTHMYSPPPDATGQLARVAAAGASELRSQAATMNSDDPHQAGALEHLNNGIELYEAYEAAALALGDTTDTAHRGYIGRGMQQLEQDITAWQNS